jgi:MFS family permease
MITRQKITVGQLVFGWLADRIGRRRVYGYGLTVIILTTLAQANSEVITEERG